MHKIIHNNFELDLTPYGISTVEENYWFSDQFFTKYSFPGTLFLEGDLLKVFGDVLDDNAKFIQTIFDVQYVFGNQLESAIFEIISHIGEKVKFKFRYGIDELPNFDKKLSELPLEQALVSDIYAHAKTIISQKWPDVNYNYPQIITNKYDTTDVTWSTFLGKINNYDGNSFFQNTITTSNFANRNIIQPLPYLLHLLKQGFLDAGFVLKGDILTNELIQKILVFSDRDYFDKKGNVSDFKVKRNEFVSQVNEVLNYNTSIQLDPSAKYLVKGKITCYSTTKKFIDESNPEALSELKYNNFTFFSIRNRQTSVTEIHFTATLHTTSDPDLNNQLLRFQGFGDSANVTPEEYVLDVTVEKLIENSPSEITIKNKLDLKEVVPDVTFGQLISEYRKLFNLDINPIKKEIYINFIEDETDYISAVDLSDFEILKPQKEFNRLSSIYLKYNQDADSEQYTSVFVDKNQVLFDDSLVTSDTETITIDAIPLPQRSEDFIETAFLNETPGESKILMVLYDGLKDDLNLTTQITELMLPNIYQSFHKKWFNFRLLSILYRWFFKMYGESLAKINKKVFAYGRYHIVKTIDKTQISEDLFEVKITTASLP